MTKGLARDVTARLAGQFPQAVLADLQHQRCFRFHPQITTKLLRLVVPRYCGVSVSSTEIHFWLFAKVSPVD